MRKGAAPQAAPRSGGVSHREAAALATEKSGGQTRVASLGGGLGAGEAREGIKESPQIPVPCP